MAVCSNSIVAPKIDRSGILKAAWAQIKGWYVRRGRTFRFIKAEFQWALRCAWHDVRMAAAVEVRP